MVPYERELFAIHQAMKAWRHYVAGSRIIIESDHKPLIWLRSQKELSRKQANWMTFLEEFQFVINYVPGKEMMVADPLSRRPDHEPSSSSPEINYHSVDRLQFRWVLRPNIFDQLNDIYGPFDNDAFSDNYTAQLPGEGVADFYQRRLAGQHSYINGPFDNKSMRHMMQYYVQQKNMNPYNTSVAFVVPLWTQKQWFQQHFSSMQMVWVFKVGQHVFLLPSDRLGRPPGQLMDVGPLAWDVGVFYDAPRFADSPYASVAYSMPMSEYMLHYIATHNEEVLITVNQHVENQFGHSPEVGLHSHPIDDDDNFDDGGDIEKIVWQNQSTAAGDLQVFAECIHDLKVAYKDDVFVKRLRIGEQIPDFYVANGVVYYRRRDQRIATLHVPTEAVPLQQKIIAEFHDTPVVGHLSVAKTLERLKRYFYFGLSTT